MLGAAALLVYAGRAIRAGELTAPLLVEFLANIAFMYDPIRRLNKVNLILQQSLAAGQRVQSIMEVPNEIRDRPGAPAAGRRSATRSATRASPSPTSASRCCRTST